MTVPSWNLSSSTIFVFGIRGPDRSPRDWKPIPEASESHRSLPTRPPLDLRAPRIRHAAIALAFAGMLRKTTVDLMYSKKRRNRSKGTLRRDLGGVCAGCSSHILGCRSSAQSPAWATYQKTRRCSAASQTWTDPRRVQLSATTCFPYAGRRWLSRPARVTAVIISVGEGAVRSSNDIANASAGKRLGHVIQAFSMGGCSSSRLTLGLNILPKEAPVV